MFDIVPVGPSDSPGKRSKTIVYSLCYGMSVEKLCSTERLPRRVVKVIKKNIDNAPRRLL